MRKGKRFGATYVDVRVALSSGQHSRIGLIVPKHGATAVKRNRLKRVLREHARLHLLGALRAPRDGGGAALDVVVRAKPAAYRAEARELKQDFARLADQVRTLAARLNDTRGVSEP